MRLRSPALLALAAVLPATLAAASGGAVASNSAKPPAELVDAILGPPTNDTWDASPVLTAGVGGHLDDEFVWQDFLYDDRQQADNAGDIVEVRLRPDGDDLAVRVVLNTLRPDDRPTIRVQLDERVVDASRDGLVVDAVATAGAVGFDEVDNVVRFSVPDGAVGDTARVNVMTVVDAAVIDLAFNDAGREPFGKISWRDEAQSAAIDAGDVNAFTVEVDLAGLRSGRTDDLSPGAGMHVRVYRSLQDLGEGYSAYGSGTVLHTGSYMPYVLYVPTGYDPSVPAPLHLVLHSLNNTHTEFTVLNVYDHVAEPYGALAITPLALGQEGWYEDQALVDTITAWDHVRATMAVDDDRTTVSGYSMGGYGTYRLATLLPDRFAAASVWAGVPSRTIGDPEPKLAMQNLLHVPFHAVHGVIDPLVPYGTTSRHVLRLQELGYTFRLNSHPNYHHWSDRDTNDYTREGAWLNGPAVPKRPGRVLLQVRPQAWATPGDGAATVLSDLGSLDVDIDGAYWVRDVVVADGADVNGMVDLTSEAVAARQPVTSQIAAAGVLLPGQGSGAGLAPQPYQVLGLDRMWTVAPTANRLSGTLAKVTALTVDLAAAGLSRDDLEIVIEADGPVVLTLVDGDWSEVVAL